MSARAGHHGDSVWKFEDAGFRTTPNDDTFKNWGGNAFLETKEGGRNAARVFNADEYAAEIIAQTFDGAWGVSGVLTEPPWWLGAVFGNPGSGTLVSGSLYDFTYNLTDGNDPVSLRIYEPTDGFSNYEMYEGCVISSVSFDQTPDGSAEFSITGAYAAPPTNQGSPSVSVNDFTESTFVNRDAEVTVGGSTVAKAQSTSITYEANVELITEIGSDTAEDYVPRQFNPSATFDHIIYASPTVDFLQRFRDETQANVVLKYDNGESGDDEFGVDLQVSNHFPDQWSETGRNDPEADLMHELQGPGDQASATITTSVTDSGTAGEVPGLG